MYTAGFSKDCFGKVMLSLGELDKGNVSPFAAWSKEDLDDGDGEEQMADRIASGDLVSRLAWLSINKCYLQECHFKMHLLFLVL